MTQFALAARAQIRNIVLCTLATLTLAACGGEAGSSSAAAASTAPDSTASDSTASLVSPNVGVIDRSQGIDATATTAAVANTGAASTGAIAATVASSTSSSSGTSSSGTVSSAAAPKITTAASGTTSGTGTTTTTTVASSNKSTAPVKATTTNGVATLDWLPPTENNDGSALTNLAGYTVYYGTSPEGLTQSIKVTNPGLTAYSVTNLPSGTWYFAVTSYSSTGVESTRTGTVSTTI
jgi:hypothetical protein